MTKLQFTHHAAHDLKRLRAFIAKHNPYAARSISQKLKKSILLLLENPQLGKESDVPANVRDYVTDPYFVRYTV